MTSPARGNANRQNARASTGPKSAAGKARASRNAYRHGLGVPVRSDPDCVGRIQALARSLAGTDASAELMARADAVAAAQTELERVRQRRQQLIERHGPYSGGAARMPGSLPPASLSISSEASAAALSDLIAEMNALDRYEQRALARRNRSTVAFDAACILDRLQRRSN